MLCLFWIALSALGLDGQVSWSPWKRCWLWWKRVGRCSRWTLSKHWEISEPWWFRPRYRETEQRFMLKGSACIYQMMQRIFSSFLNSLFYFIALWRPVAWEICPQHSLSVFSKFPSADDKLLIIVRSCWFVWFIGTSDRWKNLFS